MAKAIRQLKNKVMRILAWSYSRWKDYDKCPAYAKYKHVEKRAEAEHPSATEGKVVHEASDNYISGKLKKLPKELRMFIREYEMMLKYGAQGEQEWAFTEEWERCDWFDMQRCWVRIKADLVFLQEEKKRGGMRSTTVRVIDIKTGKEHADHAMQRSLYAVGAMLVFPDAEQVIVEHWYTQTGAKQRTVFLSVDLAKLQREWKARVVPMMADKRFAPRPGNYCRFCHFRKANGGPCQY